MGAIKEASYELNIFQILWNNQISTVCHTLPLGFLKSDIVIGESVETAFIFHNPIWKVW